MSKNRKTWNINYKGLFSVTAEDRQTKQIYQQLESYSSGFMQYYGTDKELDEYLDYLTSKTAVSKIIGVTDNSQTLAWIKAYGTNTIETGDTMFFSIEDAYSEDETKKEVTISEIADFIQDKGEQEDVNKFLKSTADSFFFWIDRESLKELIQKK